MSLDEQLAELLAQLGVVLEDPAEELAPSPPPLTFQRLNQRPTSTETNPEIEDDEDVLPFALEGDGAVDEEARGEAELSLFQTSREHYGVFYRLDLVTGAPNCASFCRRARERSRCVAIWCARRLAHRCAIGS